MRDSMWWRRNRTWVFLLLPLVALAVAASSFRLTTLYLRWEWSQPTVLRAPGVFTQSFQDVEDVRRTRTVTLGVDQVARTTVFDEDQAAPGAQLWLVELTFAAAPDQMLDNCTIELEDAAGVRYDSTGAKVDSRGKTESMPARPACVPVDAPGPRVDFTGEVVPSPVERPASWQVQAALALPAGVEPTAVRVMWDKPGYAKLIIPR